MPKTRRDLVFFVLGGFFLTNAIVAELTGGKLFTVPGFTLGTWKLDPIVLSIGVIPWPVVFITTDLINEYFGKPGVRKLTFLAVGMILYTFLLLFATMCVPAWESSPVSDVNFSAVFGQSMWIIVGSITAFLLAQLLDVIIFQAVKQRTGHRLLWLRATGSTLISQIIDTFVVGFIAFVVPHLLNPEKGLAFAKFVPLAFGNYTYKLIIAVLITPIIYLVHGVIDRYLAGEIDEVVQTAASHPGD
ncbi:MAG: queuosine precursor transporter [Planctomycetota bacterium]